MRSRPTFIDHDICIRFDAAMKGHMMVHEKFKEFYGGFQVVWLFRDSGPRSGPSVLGPSDGYHGRRSGSDVGLLP